MLLKYQKHSILFIFLQPPVIVEPDLGMQSFDLVTPNEHLHYSEVS